MAHLRYLRFSIKIVVHQWPIKNIFVLVSGFGNRKKGPWKVSILGNNLAIYFLIQARILDDFKSPCVVKATHGSNGENVRFVYTRKQYDEVLETMYREVPNCDTVTTELIQVKHLTCIFLHVLLKLIHSISKKFQGFAFCSITSVREEFIYVFFII